MTEIPSKVLVNFLVPGKGAHQEEYDMFSAQDIAVWKGNCKLTAAIQTSVTVLQTVEATEKNLRLLDAAQNMKNEIFKTLRSGE